MIVSSFIKDSSAYECGLVRDGGLLCRTYPYTSLEFLLGFLQSDQNISCFLIVHKRVCRCEILA